MLSATQGIGQRPDRKRRLEQRAHAINVNLCGAVPCCRAVLPHFRSRRSGKIILLSGGGATKPLPFLSAYAASKAALVRFGETLAEEVRSAGIDVNAVAPGALNTRLLEEVLEAGPERVGQAFYEQSVAQKKKGGTPLETGAALCAFLASSKSTGITGRLISAVWDPWPMLPPSDDGLRYYTLDGSFRIGQEPESRFVNVRSWLWPDQRQACPGGRRNTSCWRCRPVLDQPPASQHPGCVVEPIRMPDRTS